MKSKKKIAIITCCLDDWGGSEELWARSVPHLLEGGVKHLTIYKNRINKEHLEFKNLLKQDVELKELAPEHKNLNYIFSKFNSALQRVANMIGILNYQWNRPVDQLHAYLKSSTPDLVVVSQGINFDGLAFANECLKLNIPYIIICHKAVNFYWPDSGDRAFMKETLLKAEKNLFVSLHNRTITEEQFGVRLTNSEIIINPVKTKITPLPYPSTSQGYKLACIGRLLIIDKGQDILLRILQKPKWRDRDLHINIIGQGPDEIALKDMAKLLQLDNVSFIPYNTDLKSIWNNHHALILPSRSEGLPLTIIEAMSLGRTVIASNAGGNQEVVHNGITGFFGEANENALDETMEIAWNRRNDWENMGLKSAEFLTSYLPELPEKIFADLILNYLKF